MGMTADERAAWHTMSGAAKRAVRRRIAEEISQRDKAELTRLNRRADRRPPRRIIGTKASSTAPVLDDRERRLLNLRDDLEAFERGDDDLMGAPRDRVDFPAAYASIDRALALTTAN